MTIVTMGPRKLAFLLSEGPGHISRDEGALAFSQNVSPGELLGVIAASTGVTVTQAARSTNTSGSGVLTLASPAYTTKAKPGVYTVICVEPATNGGTFRVEDPKGKEIGTATVGVAFTKEVKFTIADATDFVAGDGFEITVDEGADNDGGEQYVAFDPTATNGAEVPVAVSCYAALSDADDALRIVTIRRFAEVNDHYLIWPDAITDAQKAKAIRDLAQSGLIVR
jgi:hypothetical protein